MELFSYFSCLFIEIFRQVGNFFPIFRVIGVKKTTLQIKTPAEAGVFLNQF